MADWGGCVPRQVGVRAAAEYNGGGMSLEPAIQSRQNSILKRARSILAGKLRESIALEGDRLVDDALAGTLSGALEIEMMLVAESRGERAEELSDRGVPVRLVADELLQQLSGLKAAPGILALAARPASLGIEILKPTSAPLVLVIAGVQDPGNLGALARSAEAAGTSAVVVISGGARPFGAKALRGSMGSLLRLPVVETSDANALAESLGKEGYRQVSADIRTGTVWNEFDWSVPLALWVSGETGELPPAASTFEGVTIPMQGQVESLNISVAASLLLFAAAAAGTAR